VLDLARLKQISNSPCDVFDWHIGINAVLVEQVDPVRVQPFQRLLNDNSDAGGGAVESIGGFYRS
jgi:hypothetical protein